MNQIVTRNLLAAHGTGPHATLRFDDDPAVRALLLADRQDRHQPAGDPPPPAHLPADRRALARRPQPRRAQRDRHDDGAADRPRPRDPAVRVRGWLASRGDRLQHGQSTRSRPGSANLRAHPDATVRVGPRGPGDAGARGRGRRARAAVGARRRRLPGLRALRPLDRAPDPGGGPGAAKGRAADGRDAADAADTEGAA